MMPCETCGRDACVEAPACALLEFALPAPDVFGLVRRVKRCGCTTYRDGSACRCWPCRKGAALALLGLGS